MKGFARGFARAFAPMACALLVGAAGMATAQTYPAKPVRIVVPFPPGGPTDVFARQYATRMSAVLNQSVVVDNKSGAGGAIGAVEVKRADPDGYTLLFGSASNLGLYNLMSTAPLYDAVKDFVHVASLGGAPTVFAVHPAMPQTLKGVVEMAKAKPGTLQYGSPGQGTYLHIAMERLKKEAGNIDIQHIPFRGSSQTLTSVLGGQVNMMFDNIPSSLPHIKAGKLKALATTGAKRDPALSDLPTIAEAGVPGYESGVWFGIAVPAATPKDIINKLNAETIRGAKAPEFVKRMTDLGYLIIPGTADQMTDMIKAEIVRWTPVVKSSGAKID